MLNKCHDLTKDLSKMRAQAPCLASDILLFCFQALESQQLVEALSQIAGVRPYSASIHSASALQKLSMSFLWGHWSMCSRRSPLEPSPIIPFILRTKTKWPHYCLSPMRNLNTTWVKAMTRLCQRAQFCRQRHSSNSSGWWLWFTVKCLLCLKCNMVKRSEISQKSTLFL